MRSVQISIPHSGLVGESSSSESDDDSSSRASDSGSSSEEEGSGRQQQYDGYDPKLPLHKRYPVLLNTGAITSHTAGELSQNLYSFRALRWWSESFDDVLMHTTSTRPQVSLVMCAQGRAVSGGRRGGRRYGGPRGGSCCQGRRRHCGRSKSRPRGLLGPRPWASTSSRWTCSSESLSWLKATWRSALDLLIFT